MGEGIVHTKLVVKIVPKNPAISALCSRQRGLSLPTHYLGSPTDQVSPLFVTICFTHMSMCNGVLEFSIVLHLPRQVSLYCSNIDSGNQGVESETRAFISNSLCFCVADHEGMRKDLYMVVEPKEFDSYLSGWVFRKSTGKSKIVMKDTRPPV